MSITVTDVWVLVPLSTGYKKILWTEILEIHTYKIDLMTVDKICIDLVCKESVITIDEEIEGWDSFLIKMQEIFTVIDKNWWKNVAFPPFAMNYAILYKSEES